MTDEDDVRRLIHEVLESGRPPDDVCSQRPDLLPTVRRRLQGLRLIERDLDRIFPRADAADGGPWAAGPATETQLPRVAGYEVEALLGRGGMGSVYRARHLELARTVALKMMRFATDDRERFGRECRALAQLTHEGIVAVYDVGTTDGQPYFTMEYIPGLTLETSLGGTPQPPKDAARMVAKLSVAVQAAHARGIIHRDLKPSNVLLTSEGEPKVSDFGLARFLDDGPRLTMSHVGIGTPSYMAPEQAAGKAGDVGPLADVYALGAILYEMLTGRPPFRGISRDDTVTQVIGQEPVPPSRLNPAVDRDLETICLKCLEKAPGARYQSVSLLKDDLNRFVEGEPIAARRLSAPRRLGRKAARNPARSAAFVLAFLLTSTMIGTSVITRWWSATEAAKQELESLDYAHRLALADRWREEQQFGAMLELLNECPPRERNWEWRYLKDQCRMRAILRGHTNIVTCVAVNGHAEIASASADGSVRVWAWGESRPRREFHVGGVFLRCVAFHPDDERLAFGGDDGAVYLGGKDGVPAPRVFSTQSGKIHEVAFSPDGRLLAAGGEDQTVRVWDVNTGAPVFASEPLGAQIFALAFSADSRDIFAGGGFQSIHAWGVRTGEKKFVRAGEGASVDSIRIHNRLNRAYSCDRNGCIHLWEPSRGAAMKSSRTHDDEVNCICLSRGGNWLASVSDDATLRLQDAETLAERLVLRGHHGPVNWVASHPGGETLVTASKDHTIGIWDVRDRVRTEIPARPADARDVAFSPDEPTWATAYNDGVVCVRSRKPGGAIVDLPKVGGRATALAFSGDGKQLVVAGDGESNRVAVFSTLDWQRTALWSWPKSASRSRSDPEPTRLSNDLDRDMSQLKDRSQWMSACFAPGDREVVAGCDDGHIRVWTIGDADLCRDRPVHRGPITGIAFAPGGRTLASCSLDREVVLHTWPELTVLHRLRRHDDSVFDVAFNVDGSRLASASVDATAILWRVKTGEVERILKGHTGDVVGVAFSRDGKRLATAGLDRSVRIWDVNRGHQLLRIKTQSEAPRRVRFSPDGQVLLSCGNGGHVEQWRGSEGPSTW